MNVILQANRACVKRGKSENEAPVRKIIIPVKLENKQDIVPISMHQKPAFSKSSRFNITASRSKNKPVESSAIGK